MVAYEQLRLEALGVAGELRRGLGMMVLVGEGMRRWMEAIRESKGYARANGWSSHSALSSVPLPLTVHDEATRILVSMAMRSTADG